MPQNNFGYASGPAIPANAYGNAGNDLQSIMARLMKDSSAGRPGVMEPLMQILSQLGQIEGANLQRSQYETMQPYMTDQAQQGRDTYSQLRPYMTDPYEWQREQNNAARGYLTDPYEFNRQANQRTQQGWNMQLPYMQSFYGAAQSDLNSPWRSLIQGRQF